MKRVIACILAPYLLFCVGCGSTETAASPDTETTAATQSSTEKVFEEVITYVEYDNYDDFAAAMAEEHPNVTLYVPPQEVASDWAWNSIVLDVNFYQYNFYDPENNRSIMLQICFNDYYQNIQERFEELEGYSSIDSEVVVQEDNYAVQYYPEDGDYALYGLTGTNNTFYSLVIWNDYGELDTKDDLLALREAMEL